MTENEEKFLDLLRTQHQFPCFFTFKFIGLAEDDFVARLIAALKSALGGSSELPYETQASKNDKYISVTVKPVVLSAEQVLTVYNEAKKVHGLKASI